MKTFIVQYSTPANKAAISEWTERMVEVKAHNDREAVKKFNTRTKAGTWMILDCWEK